MDLMTLIQEAGKRAPGDGLVMQFIQQNLTNATLQRRRVGQAAQTKLTFVTQELNPTNVMNNTGPIGIVVWVPRDVYTELSKL